MKEGLFLIFRPRPWPSSTQSSGRLPELSSQRAILRSLPWCSIDNDDSRDLDQLTVAEALPDGAAKVLVAIADVDAVVTKQSALDDYAQQNTTSVYTAAEIFPHAAEKLSTSLTSLNYEADRLAMVIEMVLAEDGSLKSSDIYGATVCNHAKLAYNSVAAWLEGDGADAARRSAQSQALREPTNPGPYGTETERAPAPARSP